MFWDRVAGIYDIFVNVINSKTHRALCKEIEKLFDKEALSVFIPLLLLRRKVDRTDMTEALKDERE